MKYLQGLSPSGMMLYMKTRKRGGTLRTDKNPGKKSSNVQLKVSACSGIAQVIDFEVQLPSGAERTFKSKAAAERFLAKQGWSKMTSRRNPHGFHEVFYGRSITRYNAGEYATLSHPYEGGGR